MMAYYYQRNQTIEFILMGLSENPEINKCIFVLFLVMYMITLLGDSYIMTLVAIDPKLHNPMYFFLANFSFIDICLTSVVVPQFLINFITRTNRISFACCLTQMCVFVSSANMEFFLLASMGYDRYVAICNPMHYAQVMSKKVCGLLVFASYVITTLHAMLYTLMMSQLSFCRSRQIHHFFCDLPPLLKLTCSDTSTFQLVIYTEASAMLLSPFLFLVGSYTQVIATILKMRSVEGRRKAFSTCSSHFTLTALLYTSITFMYFRPPATYSLDYDRVVSVVYTVIIPMVNPFIYSLRNKDMKLAMKKVLGRRGLI